MSEILNYSPLIIFCLLVIWAVIGLLRRRSGRRYKPVPSVVSHPASSRPVTSKPNPSLRESSSKIQSERELLATLTAVHTTLIDLLRYRAIDLYCTQYGVSWQEAERAVDQLAHASSEKEPNEPIYFQRGADPLVTALLLQAGCRDDALAYFSRRGDTTLEEAEEAINFMQKMIDEHDWPTLRERLLDPSAPDFASLQFLLDSGNRSLAIQYYRERTDTSWLDAYKVVGEMAKA